jgi:GT2 family glycosyltransferase
MELSTALEPLVTIVVVPRERFSCTRESLDSIYEHTQFPFELVYVDGNSPPPIQDYLEEQAKVRGFHLLRTHYYLSPNHARNLGLQQVQSQTQTKYLVFIDNDVIVAPGWLSHLVACAEATDAAIVGPLVCEGTPIHELVHCAGGENHVWVETAREQPRRRLREKMFLQGKHVNNVRPQLSRQSTELIEFHCMLVRTDIFEQVGPLDEKMLNTKEHLDFCMTVIKAGGRVYFEPDSLVTYVPGTPESLADLVYYMLRWSDAWQLESLHRLRDKWNLAEDGYFQAKYKKMGWRRHGAILGPLNRFLTLRLTSGRLNPILIPLEKRFNRFLTNRYAKRFQLQEQAVQPPASAQSSPLVNP